MLKAKALQLVTIARVLKKSQPNCVNKRVAHFSRFTIEARVNNNQFCQTLEQIHPNFMSKG